MDKAANLGHSWTGALSHYHQWYGFYLIQDSCKCQLHSSQPMFFSTAYYRGAMGILLVYDVTDDASFNNIRNWMRNIEQHASDNVNKVSILGYHCLLLSVEQAQLHSFNIMQVLVGNKCDMDESKRVVPYSKGQALADEFGIQFFETSAKSNLKVDEVSNTSAACFPHPGSCVCEHAWTASILAGMRLYCCSAAMQLQEECSYELTCADLLSLGT